MKRQKRNEGSFGGSGSLGQEKGKILKSPGKDLGVLGGHRPLQYWCFESAHTWEGAVAKALVFDSFLSLLFTHTRK